MKENTKSPMLYEVKINNMGISEALTYKLSNVAVMGFDEGGKFVSINRIDPGTLNSRQISNIVSFLDEIYINIRPEAKLPEHLVIGEDVKTMGIEIEYNSPYKSTVDGMLSADYKERFKDEYQQTKIRYEKLKAFCNRIEAAMRTCPGDTKRVQMPEHDCPIDLLRDQQRAMGEYLHCLEIRAVIEGIDLT